MAFLYITEFKNSGADLQGRSTVVGSFPPVTTQKIAVGTGSVQSAVLSDQTTLVRLHTDLACSFAVGANPTAAITDSRMATNATEYIAVVPGSALKIAAIAN